MLWSEPHLLRPVDQGKAQEMRRNFRNRARSGLARGALIAWLIVLPIAAQAWWAWNRHEVLPVAEGVWEVVNEVGTGAQDYWCGIGDFAIRQLRSKATQRIYVWQAVGPAVNRPGRKSVQFSFAPPPGSSNKRGYSLSIKIPGYSLNAATARYYCFDRMDDPFFRRF